MAVIFKNDVPYGGTVNDPYIRYNTITGKIQIKDAEGVWHDYADGGLQILDVNMIAVDDWIASKDTLLTSDSLTVNPFVSTLVGGHDSYNVGVKYTSEKSYDLSGFRYCYIAGSASNQGGLQGYNQNNPNGYIALLNENTGEEIVLKSFGTQSITFNENIGIGHLHDKYKIVIVSTVSGKRTGVVQFNSFKFSANQV